MTATTTMKRIAPMMTATMTKIIVNGDSLLSLVGGLGGLMVSKACGREKDKGRRGKAEGNEGREGEGTQ